MSTFPRNTRWLAWSILTDWESDGPYAEEMTSRASEGLSGPDRALLLAMVNGVLRHVHLLDAWIDFLRGGHLDHDTRMWLRLGLFQLCIMEMAPHAAVNETVALAGKARGLVNAVLRRALREPEALEKIKAEAPVTVRYSLPDFLVERWAARHGPGGAEALAEWCGDPAPVYVRVNPLIPGAAEEVKAMAGLKPVESPGGQWYLATSLPHAALAKGLVYAQDLSTAMAPVLLDPRPGHCVLDACAAPGGKTALMAALMTNKGLIMAADAAPVRLKRLEENLKRLGASIAQTARHDWIKGPMPAHLRGLFPAKGIDRILADVPCSNTGVIRRRVDVRWRLEPEFFHHVNGVQRTILQSLLPLLAIGGRLVYSTCSIEPEENTAIVEAVLRKLKGFRLLKEQDLLPHRDNTDGAYAALIERTA